MWDCASAHIFREAIHTLHSSAAMHSNTHCHNYYGTTCGLYTAVYHRCPTPQFHTQTTAHNTRSWRTLWHSVRFSVHVFGTLVCVYVRVCMYIERKFTYLMFNYVDGTAIRLYTFRGESVRGKYIYSDTESITYETQTRTAPMDEWKFYNFQSMAVTSTMLVETVCVASSHADIYFISRFLFRFGAPSNRSFVSYFFNFFFFSFCVCDYCVYACVVQYVCTNQTYGIIMA